MGFVAFDYRMLQYLNSLAGRSTQLDLFFVIAAEYTIYLMSAALLLVTAFKLRDVVDSGAAARRIYLQYLVLPLVAGTVGRLVIAGIFRAFIFRERPFVVGMINQLAAHNPLEGSFPSGHSAFMFGVAFSLFLVDRKIGTLYLLVALFSGLSRVVVGVHFPLDILAGALCGVLAAILCKWFLDEWFGKIVGAIRK